MKKFEEEELIDVTSDIATLITENYPKFYSKIEDIDTLLEEFVEEENEAQCMIE